MICPMLSALKPTDEQGNPVNRECIREECRFYNLEQRDCNLMLASTAMFRAADDVARVAAGAAAAAAAAAQGAAAGAAVGGAVADSGATAAVADLDRRLTGVGKDLLHSSLEVQGVVREAAQAILEQVASSGQILDALRAALEQRIDGLEGRLQTALQQRLDDLAQELSGALAHRLEGFERAIGETANPMRRALEESMGTLAARLDDNVRATAEVQQLTARVAEHVESLSELQPKVAERMLEELSLLQATSRKVDQAAAGFDKKLEQATVTVDKKIDRVIDDNLQISQLLTLLKGQAEKTHAALRTINEGNRAVIQAVETQLKRDQADLSRRHGEEAMESNNHGVVLYYRGALEAALLSFRKAVELTPDYAEAHNNLGLVLSRLGREAEATAAFAEALRLDPKMGEVYNNLGFLYHTSAQFERAAEMFNKAIENAADSAVAYTNLGNTFHKMKQPERAVAAWRRAVELDPLNENALRGLRMYQQDPERN
jgi:tetratricopeptide (TPR) repeat protein